MIMALDDQRTRQHKLNLDTVDGWQVFSRRVKNWT